MQAAIKFGVATSLLTVEACACTVCNTGTGVAVRAGIAQDFWMNLGMVMAPFLGTFAILALVSALAPRLFGSGERAVPGPKKPTTHERSA